MVKVLQAQIAENDKERKLVIEQVGELEEQHTTEKHAWSTENAVLQNKIDELSKALEHERKLRMEEVYKLEFQKKETARVEAEVVSLRKQLADAIQALPNLEKENELLKRRVEADKATISKMNAELGQYNYELATMENLNTRLRLRLNEADTKLGKALRSAARNASDANVSVQQSLPSLRPSLRSTSSGAGSIGQALLPSRGLQDTSGSKLLEMLQSPQTASRSGKLKQLRYEFT